MLLLETFNLHLDGLDTLLLLYAMTVIASDPVSNTPPRARVCVCVNVENRYIRSIIGNLFQGNTRKVYQRCVDETETHVHTCAFPHIT